MCHKFISGTQLGCGRWRVRTALLYDGYSYSAAMPYGSPLVEQTSPPRLLPRSQDRPTASTRQVLCSPSIPISRQGFVVWVEFFQLVVGNFHAPLTQSP